MNENKIHFIPLIAGTCSFIGLFSIPLLIKKKWIDAFDQSIISFIQSFESPTLTKIMRFFTFIGSIPTVITLSIMMLFVLYLLLKQKDKLFLFGIIIIGSQLLNKLLKQIFHRQRPDLHRLIEIGGYSFPSGHAMTAMTFYGILTFLFWRGIPHYKGKITLVLISFIFILMIGISRIYLGVHYPSDIIGGYLEGIVWLIVSISVFNIIKRKFPKKNKR